MPMSLPVQYCPVNILNSINQDDCMRCLKKNPARFMIILFIVIISSCSTSAKFSTHTLLPRAYYCSNSGNDKNNGDISHPFATLQKLSSLELHPGDSLVLESGQTFTGTLVINRYASPLAGKPVLIFSSGKEKAIIDGGIKNGLEINEASFVQVQNFLIKGAGRKEGNTGNGVLITKSANISVDNLNITGFQKAGLFVNASSVITVTHIYAYENGFAGISISGEDSQRNAEQILVSDCVAENNPGDPSNFTNHSGNGIIAGNCKNVIIQYCTATNNGWDMPRVGNGLVGIWCYEADSVTIQYCIAHDNKTAKGADDGGGFDFDGGVTNSVIQYCLSYKNQGSAFGIFQYKGASPWHNNIIRKSISKNDGEVSAAHAAVYIWNSSDNEDEFKTLSFRDNIILNANGAAIHFAVNQSRRKDFEFLNNIFVANDDIIKGEVSADTFFDNNWWSIVSGFNVDGMKDFKTWAAETGKEFKNGIVTGTNYNPHLENEDLTTISDPHGLKVFIDAQLSKYKIGEDKKTGN